MSAAAIPSLPGGRRSVRSTVVHDLLATAVARQVRISGSDVLDVLDVGGGTGGLAVPLAVAGHRVTVVDPSPDALAALERRSAEMAAQEPGQRLAGAVRAVQGDAAALLDVVRPDSADLVLCHGVLEVVEEPDAALRAVATVLRPDGAASVLVAQRLAVVLAKAAAGHLSEARAVLDDPAGRWGPADPLPRRFDRAEVERMLSKVGLRASSVHGVGVFADLVPASVADLDPATPADLLALESVAADHPVLIGIAAQLHVLALHA